MLKRFVAFVLIATPVAILIGLIIVVLLSMFPANQAPITLPTIVPTLAPPPPTLEIPVADYYGRYQSRQILGRPKAVDSNGMYEVQLAQTNEHFLVGPINLPFIVGKPGQDYCTLEYTPINGWEVYITDEDGVNCS